MAYYDYDGRITIDEAAANSDIHLMEQAKAILADAQKSMEQVICCAQGCQGETAQAILEKAAEMSKKTAVLVESLCSAQNTIRHTIQKYYQIDQQVKAEIKAQG